LYNNVLPGVSNIYSGVYTYIYAYKNIVHVLEGDSEYLIKILFASSFSLPLPVGAVGVTQIQFGELGVVYEIQDVLVLRSNLHPTP
jgi:hypothetical protein